MGSFSLPQDADTVIVGAGPIGLLNAIGLLNKKPDSKIVLLEKYETYKRDHVVKLNYRLVQRFMDTCGYDETLYQLIQRLKKNQHIRIQELEELLKSRAQELGAQVLYKTTVTDLSKDVMARFPHCQLLIGADGARSMVNQSVFGDENIERKKFGYTLQFRYEMMDAAETLDTPTLIKFMQSHGVVCNEYVGKKNKQGKVPITFQLIISEEHYNQLQQFKSGPDALRPFDPQCKNSQNIPKEVLKCLESYLGLRLRLYRSDQTGILLESAKLIVNETPTSRAQTVYGSKKFLISKQSNVTEEEENDEESERAEETQEKKIVLLGDAALGLSFFKGLNAGVEASAHFLQAATADDPHQGLQAYAQWFNRYAHKKVQEVSRYQKINIAIPKGVFGRLAAWLGDNSTINTTETVRSFHLYRGYRAQQQLEQDYAGWILYPHRVRRSAVITYSPAPVSITLKKMAKFTRNFFTPYKSNHHLGQDLLQPYHALYELLAGIAKVSLAVPIFLGRSTIDVITAKKRGKALVNIKDNAVNGVRRVWDGGARFAFGVMLTATLVMLPLRIIVRGLRSLTTASSTIETNNSMRKLLHLLERDDLNIEQKNALCIDMHTKYRRALRQGQSTTINPDEEKAHYKDCCVTDPASYDDYFKLFKPQEVSSSTPMPQTSSLEHRILG